MSYVRVNKKHRKFSEDITTARRDCSCDINMHGMRDGCRVVLLLLLTSAIAIDGFLITQSKATKVVDDASFVVVCRDDVHGLAVTWHNPKGDVLGPKTRPKVVEVSYGYPIIFTTPHKVEDTGNYTCSTSKDKRVFELIVEAPLKFTDTATNQSAVEGQDFVLKCEVTGGTVSWAMEDGGIIENGSKYKVFGDGLFISNVSRHDSKTYICKGVQPRTGMVLDRKIHFHVKHKPIHPNHPQKHMRQDVVYGYINGTVNLTCVAIANPPASFEWKVNDKKAKVGHIINESQEVSILQLHLTSKTAFGNYKCTAKNKYGSYEENFTLKEGVKPVAPSGVQMKKVEPNSAVFEILGPERTPEMDLDTRGFSLQYRKIDEKEWKQKEFNITQSNLYSLDDLDPNTDYELQAATRNAAGLSDYFPAVQWKTSRGVSIHLTLPLLYGLGALILLENLAFW